MALGGRTAKGVFAALLVAPAVTAGGLGVRATVMVRLDDLVPVPDSYSNGQSHGSREYKRRRLCRNVPVSQRRFT
jgi:hypothetical protein